MTARKVSRKGRSIRSPRTGTKVAKPTYPTKDELDTIQQAAIKKGQSDSGFMVDAAVKEANKVLAKQ